RFEKYTSTERMLNAPDKYYYEDWFIINDSLKVSSFSFDKMSFEAAYKLERDTMKIPLGEIAKIYANKIDETNTIVAIAIPVALAILLIIAAANFEPFETEELKIKK
ncbi:MAG: hypothetical protein R3250_12295, partial [Melioribacteraceae bacterium]|nr:hypothetical protein [Melioribacteraceae bacterium]